MAIRPILQHPKDNQILRIKSADVTNFTEAKKIASDLIDTLNSSRIPGAGLSGAQIGVNLNIFVARKFFNENDNDSKYQDFIIINPKFKNKSQEKSKSLEACLSIEDVYGFVERHKKVGITYLDLTGKSQILRTGGFLSFVIQHEMDHLNGVLFIDKLIDNKTYTEKQIDSMFRHKEVRAD